MELFKLLRTDVDMQLVFGLVYIGMVNADGDITKARPYFDLKNLCMQDGDFERAATIRDAIKAFFLMSNEVGKIVLISKSN
jgi:hypothetical protein